MTTKPPAPKVRQRKKKLPDQPFVAEPFDDATLDWLATAANDDPFITTGVAYRDIELDLDPRTSQGRSVRRLIATIEKHRPRILQTIDREAEQRANSDRAGKSAAASEDDLYAEAVRHVRAKHNASPSYVQRMLQIGYNRAARLIERMEDEHVVTKTDSLGNRSVLSPAEQKMRRHRAQK